MSLPAKKRPLANPPPSVYAYAAENLLQGEAARYLRAQPRTLERWRLERVGPPYIKVGHRVVYRRVDLDTWLLSRRVDPGAR